MYNRFQHSRFIRKALACITLATFLFGLSGCGKKTPREALEEAYQKTFFTGSHSEALLGLTDINAKLKEQDAHSKGFSLTLQQVSGDELNQYSGFLSGLGISVDTASDLLNRKASGTMDITYGGTTYLSLGGQIQNSKVHLFCPQLLHGSLMVNLNTIKEDLASDSMIGQMLRDSGVTLPDNLVSELTNVFLNPTSLMDVMELTSALEDLNEEIEVTKLKKKEISLPADVTAKNVYLVTVPKDAYADALLASTNALMDYYASLAETLGETDTFDAEYEKAQSKEEVKELSDALGDIVLTVAVNKAGYICYVESEAKYEEETLSLTAYLENTKEGHEEIELDLRVETEDNNIKMLTEYTFDADSQEIAVSSKLTEDNITLLSVACEGEFQDVKKGESYTLDFDFIEFEFENELSVSMAGDCYIDTTRCDISAPSGTAYNVLTMTQSELTNLVTEIIINLQNDPLLSGLLGNLDFDM